VKWVVSALITSFVLLAIWTAYANVLSDDTALRARADTLAREKAGCGNACKLIRAEGSRGIIEQRITYRFSRPAVVTVACRRRYVVFGSHVCDATKQ
jgi:hypothetical protein